MLYYVAAAYRSTATLGPRLAWLATTCARVIVENIQPDRNQRDRSILNSKGQTPSNSYSFNGAQKAHLIRRDILESIAARDRAPRSPREKFTRRGV